MANPYWSEITTALDMSPEPVSETGHGDLPSVFGVSDFACATIGAAGAALADLQGLGASPVHVDRRLASLWFDMTLVPDGWEMPSIWDPIAGVYATSDGFIRLHTNAPHHRDAALQVLDCAGTRDAVAARVSEWRAEALETAIVAAKGCAAALRGRSEWMEHPQGIAVRAEPLICWHPEREGEPVALPKGDQPLAGIKVLDLTRVLAGPVASRFLAGFGADVLRIDPPNWNEPAAEAEVNLGKTCAGLDLRNATDRELFENLLAQADLLLHGYRPGALEGLGYDPQTRHRLNPGLIDVSLSAYGRAGPWNERRGFDSLVQMSCGIASEGQRISGADGPVPLPVQALDHGTGYLVAATALRALARRAKGVILRAELSLARTAETLMKTDGSLTPDEPIKQTDSDLSQYIEQTAWGPARRFLPSLKVNERAPAWPIPSGPVRRHAPRWR
ncbi:CoA transferase [Primorskyibacter aestuariivivens]|uniref:CoA transferase n=1 Tax=Primorskyibacter aestuariivivens TaxID=1888912 RepID=UPI002301A0C8|nr:CoA transferase [Primorskyibacter aestuariivivens]MDA7427897.1 CoA transferase [Primorskyibacter aestuariivivens]